MANILIDGIDEFSDGEKRERCLMEKSFRIVSNLKKNLPAKVLYG
jgi:type II restriction/modification system DNA methylase subunit YeeA